MVEAIASILVALLTTAHKLIAANGDAAKEEEAMMEAQEAIKAELDRRKFQAPP